uniref:Uncharacterized protein n=1 Tax=Aureoumbra lagunensis TaxID=44058 RepID=A0A7S3NPK9_9STRA|mmetsp:Transcript_8429/g.12860  ORF Transcript_8429/g.12860 Transcript_8429/m.12860 type:complete len:451 (+) Transcript_8429:25-1377(+)
MAAARRWTSRALNKAMDALDRAETSVLGLNEEDDILNDPRVIEYAENLKEEMREEIEIQRSVFESKIKELQHNDDAQALEAIDTILLKAGIDEKIGKSLKEKINLIAHLLSSLRNNDDKILDSDKEEQILREEITKLRKTFEAARASHEYESARLQDEILFLKSKKQQQINTEQSRLHTLFLQEKCGHDAADACGTAAILLLERRDVKSSTFLATSPSSSTNGDENTMLNMQLRNQLENANQRIQQIEMKLQRAEREAQRAEQARAKLDVVLRSFQKQQKQDQTEVQIELESRLAQLETELGHRDARLADLEAARLYSEQKANRAIDTAAMADAEMHAARAALNAAIAQRDNLARRLVTLIEETRKRTTNQEELLIKQSKTSHDNSSSNNGASSLENKEKSFNASSLQTRSTLEEKKQKGFAALFLDFVDEELERDNTAYCRTRTKPSKR